MVCCQVFLPEIEEGGESSGGYPIALFTYRKNDGTYMLFTWTCAKSIYSLPDIGRKLSLIQDRWFSFVTSCQNGS